MTDSDCLNIPDFLIDKMQAHKEKYTALRRERRLAEQEAAVLEVMVEEANTNE